MLGSSIAFLNRLRHWRDGLFGLLSRSCVHFKVGNHFWGQLSLNFFYKIGDGRPTQKFQDRYIDVDLIGEPRPHINSGQRIHAKLNETRFGRDAAVLSGNVHQTMNSSDQTLL